jgi:hypothetical protein
LTPEGVLVTTAVDASMPSSHFQVRLDRLGAGDNLVRDIQLASPEYLLLVYRRPGYFVYEAPMPGASSPNAKSSIHLLFDDGREEVLDLGEDAGWHPLVAAEGYSPSWDNGTALGTSRHLILIRTDRSQVGLYDLDAHTMRPLFYVPAHGSSENPHPQPGTSPPPPFIFDENQELFWGCGQETFSVSLPTGEEHDFATECIDLHLTSGEEGLVQGPAGDVYALSADGSAAERLRQIDLFSIRAAHGRRFVYAPAGSTQYAQGAFDGWLDDGRQVMHAGLSPRFSANGKRLRWLENANVDEGAGDLYSLDLETGKVRHLVRNVTQFRELPDGRLAAIANAAAQGAWNRAVVVDDEQGQARWLGKGVQWLEVVGDDVVLGRSTSQFESILVHPPARGR